MRCFATWKERARTLALEVGALGLACRHPATPWYAKLLAACVVAYFFSPIDLIPDPIPLLGHLDDLLLIPLGIVLVRSLIPAAVLAECRARAEASGVLTVRGRWVAAAVVGACWSALALLAVWLFLPG